jgi:hypothetical protein
MPLGAENSNSIVAKSDTAELYSYIYDADDQVVPQADIASVTFTVRLPDDTTVTTPGVVQPDGAGFLRWTDTTQTGVYVWVAQFTLLSGEKRSFREEFVVEDLLAVPSITRNDTIADQVWMRIEDCFDSEEGGPYLRDMTMAYFDKSKVAQFISEGLLLINSWPPTTTVDLSFFTTEIPHTDPAVLALDPDAKQPDPDQIVIVQATLLATIKHLMRSYVEQPNVVGANVVWEDRREYLQRWQTIYTIEQDYFKQLLALWKRQFLAYGKSSLLVNSKAGRLGYYPGFRTRNIGRGWL